MDEGKVSLVEFMRSIKYKHHQQPQQQDKQSEHFADFRPRARRANNSSAEERQLVRSAN
jgi:hypothetical protein